jgi:hypothetical protein
MTYAAGLLALSIAPRCLSLRLARTLITAGRAVSTILMSGTWRLQSCASTWLWMPGHPWEVAV